MVRKIRVLLVIVLLLCAIGTTAHATSYTVYEGTPSNTYIQYFRDIVSGIGFNDNYVAFRSGQYEYVLIVGDLAYDGSTITLQNDGSCYVISSNNSYNSQYTYEYKTISSATVATSDRIIYSDVGNYPQLVERGAKYEMLSAVLLCVALLGVVVGRIFSRR